MINVGVRLGLNHVTLDASSNFLTDMITAWLRKDGNVLKVSGKPTWASLCKALEECSHNGIAHDIRSRGKGISMLLDH